MLALGLSSSLGSFVLGVASDRVGRLPCVMLTFAAGLVATALFQRIEGDAADFSAWVIGTAAIAGLMDTGVSTLLSSTIGAVFQTSEFESAFSAAKFAESLANGAWYAGGAKGVATSCCINIQYHSRN